MDVFNGSCQIFLKATTNKNVHRNALYVTHKVTLKKKVDFGVREISDQKLCLKFEIFFEILKMTSVEITFGLGFLNEDFVRGYFSSFDLEFFYLFYFQILEHIVFRLKYWNLIVIAKSR